MVRAYRRKSLTTAGIVIAVITGIIHSATDSSVNLALLIGFFITGTVFTKVKADVKRSLTVHIDDKGSEFHETRNHIQVLANSVVASILIIIQLAIDRQEYPRYWQVTQVGIVAQYAAVTADTWSSELGILSKTTPRLITTLKPCPKGTNGGVSELGLRVALFGGFFVGGIASFFSPVSLIPHNGSPGMGIPSLGITEWTVLDRAQFIFFTGVVGLFGSLLDSLLGALFQKSLVNREGKIIEVEGGYRFKEASLNKVGDVKAFSGLDILSNNQVNFAMAISTTILTMIAWWTLF
ncbi:hypothetical protein AWJ20_3539 [Sugiyamaella lignohabitans]|uniref:DUF92 domain-containing protein n=1 Tax=Sugiyamaella lignohabitans TaxID=796027 RepID=A0A167FZA1_9ASCO|nr:uncharacterized protein AWJ20_3539 [Sugiyamaella lignohabitans]ANB15895.1 hypothetical protein AWJ20_3539 [Sugiyamaella lignohabitans]